MPSCAANVQMGSRALGTDAALTTLMCSVIKMDFQYSASRNLTAAHGPHYLSVPVGGRQLSLAAVTDRKIAFTFPRTCELWRL